jgi:hypothetical protein
MLNQEADRRLLFGLPAIHLNFLAAAMTYVAGTLTSILQLFFIIRARGFQRRQDDKYV